MGWSATQDACHKMDEWIASCVHQTGSQNLYRTDEGMYEELFWERGREQADGSITGSVFSMSGYRRGSFKINADGSVARYPTKWPFKRA